MSLRQQARILGIAPPYLSMMINGKRPWKPGIKERYDELVNSMPKSVHNRVNSEPLVNSRKATLTGTKLGLGGAEGTRTPDPLLAKQMLSQLSYSPIMIHPLHTSHF